MPRTLIRNLGLVLSGDLSAPILDTDALLIEDGRIAALGPGAAEQVIDAQGCAVCPGLIDNHTHPVFGDWTPRQNQLGWIEAFVHGGVTTLISAGEVHLPGRPRDVLGAKSLAIVAQRAFAGFRPLGAKVLAGAVVPERGMTEADFAELGAAGVTLMGEIGLGTVREAEEAAAVTRWARAAGMTGMLHLGGPSIAGSNHIGADVAIAADADIVAHVNGGPTSLPEAEIARAIAGTTRAIEVVHNGNPRTALFALRTLQERDELARLVIGTDSPAGSGVQPLGVLRTISLLVSLGGLAPELAVCAATGNTARWRGFDAGRIAVGLPADLVFLDHPQGGTGPDVLASLRAGDLPGIGMVMIDGTARLNRSRNTPPAERVPT